MAKKSSTKKGGDPLIGAVVDRRWQVLDQLGAGGMGVVYRAERVGLGKQVALKFLHQSVAESNAAVARFEREAKAISRLHHLHCISILDYGVWRKQPYIVMEFVQGVQLSELDMETLPTKRAVALMRQVLLGLQHAHSRGVIHRDLKLTNIMLVEMTGTENLVKILDFGLARISGINEERSLTEGLVAGTPSYMSPEQALGKKTDERSDIYSAGVILYVLCTGKRPFAANDTTALLRMQVQDPPPPPRRMAPQKKISDGLERVILRTLEKRPADRFQNVGEFLHALEETTEGQETMTPTVARQRRPRRRLTMIAAACIALGAGGALFARAHFLRLRSQAVGAYQRWTGPATPAPAPDGRDVAPTEKSSTTPTEKPSTTPTEKPSTTPTEKSSTTPTVAPSAAPTEKPGTTPAVAPSAAPTVPAAAADAAIAPAAASPATPELPTPPGQRTATSASPPAPAPKPAAPPEPAARAPEPKPPRTRSAAREPPTKESHEWRQQIESLLADGKLAAAKTQLRDRIAVDKGDAWAHLRLGDLYADPYHYRRDAFREWTSAFAVDPALKSDATFRKSLCETLEGSDRSGAQQFLAEQLGAEQAPALLMSCVRATADASRIESAARLIEATAGPERPEIGMAAMRLLDVGKSCAQKKSAVELIRRSHYLRARGALIKLDRVRLAHPGHPPAAVACFGTSIAEAIESLK